MSSKMITMRMENPKLTGAEIKVLVERGNILFQALFDKDIERAKMILECDKELSEVMSKW